MNQPIKINNDNQDAVKEERTIMEGFRYRIDDSLFPVLR